MRRKRHRETKVWRDPHLSPAGGNANPKSDSRRGKGKKNGASNGNGEDRRRRRRAAPVKRDGARIIAGPKTVTDPTEIERARLLDRVLIAEGRPSITRAVEDFLGAGFTLPAAQEPWLQVLEHNDESRVVEAIQRLTSILDEEEPKRRKVLESRLRRIEEFADESSTQRAATDLRRVLQTRYSETLS